MSVGLKICGIRRRVDLDACLEERIDAIGFNFWPRSPRAVSVEEARALVEDGTGALMRVGVFVDASPPEVFDTARAVGLDAIQLHGDLAPEPYVALGLPWIMVVRGTPSLSEIVVPEPLPIFVLLDAAAPGFGGSGVTTDFAWAAGAVRHFAPLPVWLAGGINPANAAHVIARVSPHGLDVASGAEISGAKRGEKSAAAIAELAAICQKERQ